MVASKDSNLSCHTDCGDVLDVMLGLNQRSHLQGLHKRPWMRLVVETDFSRYQDTEEGWMIWISKDRDFREEGILHCRGCLVGYSEGLH